MRVLYGPHVLGEAWSLPVEKVIELAKSGQIPTVKIGENFRFDPNDVERFVMCQLKESRRAKRVSGKSAA